MAVPTDKQKQLLNRWSKAYKEANVGDRLAKLDSDGSYTGTISGTATNLDLGDATTPTAGSLDVFPAATGGANDKLTVTALTNGGNRGLGIVNRAMGQATALGIPDPGAASGEFVLTNSAHQLIVNCNGADRTLALNGNVTAAGALDLGDHALTINTSASTEVTLPTTGTLSAIDGIETISAVKTFTAIPIINLDNTTDGVQDGLVIKHSSSDNNATALDGAGVAFWLENATGTSTVEKWAGIAAQSTTLTNGVEDGDIVLSTMLAGTVTEAARVDASDQSLTLGQNATDANGLNKVRIFPLTASKGSLVIQAADADGDTVTTIVNDSMAGARTLTIPDGGAATENFAYGDSAGDIAVANLAAAVQDLVPTATVTAAAEGTHARVVTVQVKDAAGNNLAAFHELFITVNATGSALTNAPAATGTDTFGAPSAGIVLQEIVAKASYRVMTDTNGVYAFTLTHSDAGSSRWIGATVGSRGYTSAEITFDAV